MGIDKLVCFPSNLFQNIVFCTLSRQCSINLLDSKTLKLLDKNDCMLDYYLITILLFVDYYLITRLLFDFFKKYYTGCLKKSATEIQQAVVHHKRS